MGIYFRRSKKIGPFRITLSKRGISTSIGDSHFRLTKGTRGTYVSSTLAGVTMRQRLDQQSVAPSAPPVHQPTATLTTDPTTPQLSATEINAKIEEIRKDLKKTRLIKYLFQAWFISLIVIGYFIGEMKGPSRENAMALFGLYGIAGMATLFIMYIRAKQQLRRLNASKTPAQ